MSKNDLKNVSTNLIHVIDRYKHALIFVCSITDIRNKRLNIFKLLTREENFNNYNCVYMLNYIMESLDYENISDDSVILIKKLIIEINILVSEIFDNIINEKIYNPDIKHIDN